MSSDREATPPEWGRSAVEGTEVVFRLADPEHHLSGVRLWQQLGLAPEATEFKPVEPGWELRIPRPSVHRLEYLFEVRDAGGIQQSRPDPVNPLRVAGPFGEHSWLPLPGYAEPAWLHAEQVPATVRPLMVPGTQVGRVHVEVWSPADAPDAEPLPLLIVHDGPELARYAALTTYAGATIAARRVARFRLALVEPRRRNVWYSANAAYARALVDHVLPAVRSAYACHPGPVLAGASLGALAGLHAEWNHPGTFAGLFCQSGSFFTMDTDPQERRFSHFPQVTRFVRRVLNASAPPSRPVIAMTCGSSEENVHNNRVMAAKLAALGLDVRYAESPDMHNFTAWRDVLDPGLTGLLRRLWGEPDGT